MLRTHPAMPAAWQPQPLQRHMAKQQEEPEEPPVDSDAEASKDEAAEQMDTDAGRRALEALRRENKALKKQVSEFKPVVEKVRQQEDEEKSEAQRLREQYEAAEAERQQLILERNRLKVASTKGLPGWLADRLVGDDEDAIAADADGLLSALEDYAKSLKPPSTTSHDTGAGKVGPADDTSDPLKLAAAVRRR